MKILIVRVDRWRITAFKDHLLVVLKNLFALINFSAESANLLVVFQLCFSLFLPPSHFLCQLFLFVLGDACPPFLQALFDLVQLPELFLFDDLIQIVTALLIILFHLLDYVYGVVFERLRLAHRGFVLALSLLTLLSLLVKSL